MPEVVTRREWRAGLPTDELVEVSSAVRSAFVLHHSTGRELGRDDSAAWVRELQRFHQGPQRGWSDIGYHWLVDQRGVIYEGRGWRYSGAHAPGHNVTSWGVCYLGSGSEDGYPVPAVARSSIRWLYDVACDRARRELRKLAHRDVRETACPGDELYRWLRDGMPYPETPRRAAPPGVKPLVPQRKGHPRMFAVAFGRSRFAIVTGDRFVRLSEGLVRDLADKGVPFVGVSEADWLALQRSLVTEQEVST